jgi:hypothetical protein
VEPKKGYELTDAERAYMAGMLQQLNLASVQFASALNLIQRQQGLTECVLSDDGKRLVPRG